jgi:hypothetical protein
VLSAEDQLHVVEDRLLASGGQPIGAVSVAVEDGDTIGRLDARLRYDGGYVLSIRLALIVTRAYPVWTHYSFHLQDGQGRCVFRYDNAPHFPEMATFPDHKHVGHDELPEEHERPSLRLILAEVAAHTSA